MRREKSWRAPVGLLLLCGSFGLLAPQSRANEGALTLSDSSSLSAESSNTAADIALPPPAFEADEQQNFSAQTSVNDSLTWPSMPALPQYSTGEEIALGQDIEPVAEPGTWIVAALASAYVIWKRRKSIIPRFRLILISAGRLQQRHALLIRQSLPEESLAR